MVNSSLFLIKIFKKSFKIDVVEELYDLLVIYLIADTSKQIIIMVVSRSIIEKVLQFFW
jgi:hypothetical protein